MKGTKDKKTLLACIVALGTNMSLGRMGEISDMDVQDLQTTYRNFFRLETLKEANDLIANATAKLSIFRHYDIETDVLHSSSDGQRFETQRNTINARHTSKYFGLKKGISAMTLIGNHVPINEPVDLLCFRPISALYEKNNPRNIDYMPPVIFFICLDLERKFH